MSFVCRYAYRCKLLYLITFARVLGLMSIDYKWCCNRMLLNSKHRDYPTSESPFLSLYLLTDQFMLRHVSCAFSLSSVHPPRRCTTWRKSYTNQSTECSVTACSCRILLNARHLHTLIIKCFRMHWNCLSTSFVIRWRYRQQEVIRWEARMRVVSCWWNFRGLDWMAVASRYIVTGDWLILYFWKWLVG